MAGRPYGHCRRAACCRRGYAGPRASARGHRYPFSRTAPPLAVVPETPWVQYVPPVPAEPANLFFYNGQYWAFANGGWYLGPGFNGPWIVVAPEFVPRPVLLVPMPYYHVPPGHWGQWEDRRPPRWHE